MTDVLQYGEPVLHRSALKCNDFEKLKPLVEKMRGVMRSRRGVGLAAPQIGVALRVFVYEWEGYRGVFVNPEILDPVGHQVGDEGCLSIAPAGKPLYFQTPRANQVSITGQDERGNYVGETVQGFLARIFQHEVDHLNGLLFVNRLSRGPRRAVERALAR